MLLSCQMRPNCFGCTKEPMNSLSLACKEPRAWLSLSSTRYLETLSFSSASLWLSLCLPPLFSLPSSLSQHYWPSRISYHTCPVPTHSQWLPIQLHKPCNGVFTVAHRYGTCPAGNEQLAKRRFPHSVGKLQVKHFLKHYLYLTKANRKQWRSDCIT